jgi:hypothetical protein
MISMAVECFEKNNHWKRKTSSLKNKLVVVNNNLILLAINL